MKLRSYQLMICLFVVGIVGSFVMLLYTTIFSPSERILEKDGIYLRIFGGEGQTFERRARDWFQKLFLERAVIKHLGWRKPREVPRQRDGATWISFDIASEKWEGKRSEIRTAVPYKGKSREITREVMTIPKYYYEHAIYFLICIEKEIKAVIKGENHTFLGTLNRPKEDFPGLLSMLPNSGANLEFTEYGRCEKCGRITVLYLCECGKSHCLDHWPQLFDTSKFTN